MYNGFYEYNGDILKWSSNKGYFLKMTGWSDKNPDRRILESELKVDKLNKINKALALEQINTIWNSGVREWEFDGQKYENSIQEWNKIPKHRFPHTWIEKDKIVGFSKELGRYVREPLPEPIEHTYYNAYKLVWHQGHVYWAICSHYWPRVQLMAVESLDIEPHDFIKWTNVYNCRGIVNLKTGEAV